MLTTVGLLAALSLAAGEPGQLTVTDVRTTHGILGPTRPDNKFLAGDAFVVSFNMEGAKVEGGKIRYGIGMQVIDASGKVLYKQDPVDNETKSPADGDKIAAFARLEIGTEQPAGDYTLKITVADRNGRVTQDLTRAYQVLPTAFGLVRPATTSDPDGKKPTAALRKGRPGWINFAAVGFGWDKAKGQPHLNATMRVLDEDGNTALARPSSGTIDQDVPRGTKAIPMQFELTLQKAGKFTVELEAVDEVTGEKTSLSLPIRVADSN
jgi:hypothetical protein